MGVSSSLYASISGLSTMGEAMSVLGDNVSNVNTVSFKSSRTTFQDVLAQSVSTAAGSAQVGRGVTLSSVSGLFAQGSFESSSSATDMAIGGQGFFMMRAAESSEADLYTRAGEFDFDQEGYIVNPVGHLAQGWEMDPSTGERAGTIGDMRIDKTTPPVATLEIEVITNLDAREDNEDYEERLFDAWDGTNASGVNPTDPINIKQFDYTTAIRTYDSKGASHDMTVYFDRTSIDNQWEVLVTVPPAEDKRNLDAEEKITYIPDSTYNYENHKGAGALIYALIDFNVSGEITSMQAYKVPPDGKVDTALAINRMSLSSTDNYFKFDVNFTGGPVDDEVSLNLGAQFTGGTEDVKQMLVSSQGSKDGNDASAKSITAETIWSDVYDENKLQVSGVTGGNAADSDSITVIGYDNVGVRKTVVYFVDSGAKVQEFLTALDVEFKCKSTIDSEGRLVMEDSTAGKSGFNIVSFVVDGDNADPGPNDGASPFGQTVAADPMTMSTLAINSSKRKVVSQGQLLNSSPAAITDPSTTWSSVQDSGGDLVAVGDIYTITGTSGDGVAVSETFEVVAKGTIQDFMDYMEEIFLADVDLDGSGRIVITDRRSDTAGRVSSLAIASIVSGAASEVFDEPSMTDGTTATEFYTIEGVISGENGSLEGTTVSSSFVAEALSTTQYANSSTTIFQDQDGFASGFLQGVSVDTDGIITGSYSNGQVLKKAQIALANFSSLAGLFKEGGNIYRETTASGAPVSGAAGTNGLGSIAPNSLEQSNVDLGTEFVKLITVQRGFQANSKIITTVDEMMNDLINMKR